MLALGLRTKCRCDAVHTLGPVADRVHEVVRVLGLLPVFIGESLQAREAHDVCVLDGDLGNALLVEQLHPDLLFIEQVKDDG